MPDVTHLRQPSGRHKALTFQSSTQAGAREMSGGLCLTPVPAVHHGPWEGILGASAQQTWRSCVRQA